jgi:preprotein translocase subunit SecY
MEERRGGAQLIVSVSMVVSLLVASISLVTFIQSAERRITVIEVKLEQVIRSLERVEEIGERKKDSKK